MSAKNKRERIVFTRKDGYGWERRSGQPSFDDCVALLATQMENNALDKSGTYEVMEVEVRRRTQITGELKAMVRVIE